MNNRENEYVEIDLDQAEKDTKIASIEGKFYFEDLQQRKLFLNADIDDFTIGDIKKHILRYNAIDKEILPSDRKPILLYLSSNGGSIDAGFELIDIIKMSKTPIYTINLGYWYSMAFLIGLAGHKRFASQNATFLIHDGTSLVYSSGGKVQDRIEFQKKVDDRIKQFILSHSKITEEEYDKNLRIEWYLFADEAKEKGFVDRIIGEDCTIDDII